MNTNKHTDDAAHLAWCALMALHFALQDGTVTSHYAANLFLTRWLAEARRQRRFPKSVAEDINILLYHARGTGMQVDLVEKLNSMWMSCSGQYQPFSDYVRLKLAIEMIKGNQWHYIVQSEAEWQTNCGPNRGQPSNTIWMLRPSLDTGFDEEGRQIMPLKVKLGGNTLRCSELLARYQWALSDQDDHWLLQAEEA